MYSLQHRFEISLPNNWEQQLPESRLTTDVDKMRFVIDLAQWNVHGKSGGPFASAVFCRDTSELISIGVNRVVPENCSLAHAEALAIALAQQQMKTHDLSSAGSRCFELFASGQPCVQCFGMVWWSGVTRLVIGARSSDIEELTAFREGPLPDNWQGLLGRRTGQPPIEVVTDVERDRARAVLKSYSAEGGENYGPVT
jgi:tRNA(Arg) A34 adenosine deaminase TadA